MPTAMTRALGFTWDEPTEAATPRGWMQIEAQDHPDRADLTGREFDYFVSCGGLCCGHYLAYDESFRADGARFMWVAYFNRHSIGGQRDVRLGYGWCHSAEGCRATVEGIVRTYLGLSQS